jgi:hypothetical protein
MQNYESITNATARNLKTVSERQVAGLQGYNPCFSVNVPQNLCKPIVLGVNSDNFFLYPFFLYRTFTVSRFSFFFGSIHNQ